MRVCHYLIDRGAAQFSKNYDFYTSDDTAYNMHRRVIVPFIWNDKIIGYTARAMDEGVKPKYHNSHEPNFVFNVNNQLPNAKFVIVCEGPFDAISVDGVAILGNRVSEQQADIIDSLAREVVVVPDWDFDNKGKWTGKLLVDDALEYGWAVSFPVWRETCKDINDAVIKYGKLFVIKSILDSVEKSRLKIELMKKRIHTS
jgi:DNA primase